MGRRISLTIDIDEEELDDMEETFENMGAFNQNIDDLDPWDKTLMLIRNEAARIGEATPGKSDRPVPIRDRDNPSLVIKNASLTLGRCFIPILMRNPDIVASVQIVLRYNPEEIVIKGSTLAERSEDAGMTVSYNILEVGKMKEIRVAILSFEGSVYEKGSGVINILDVELLKMPAKLNFVIEGDAVSTIFRTADFEYNIITTAGTITEIRDEVDKEVRIV